MHMLLVQRRIFYYIYFPKGAFYVCKKSDTALVLHLIKCILRQGRQYKGKTAPSEQSFHNGWLAGGSCVFRID